MCFCLLDINNSRFMFNNIIETYLNAASDLKHTKKTPNQTKQKHIPKQILNEHLK